MPPKLILLFVLLAGQAFYARAAGKVPTFNKDVQPIIASRCVSCHRSGEIGPMEFSSYAKVRPWAKSIKQNVLSRRMPPWFADPHYGKFSNDRSMPQSEIDTLVQWADGGAPEGAAKDRRPQPTFVDGWNIPQPDLVISAPKPFDVPKEGKVDYQYIVIPMGLTEDKWVETVEARPTDRTVVHHIVIFVRDPQSNWLRGEAEPGVAFVPPRTNKDGKPRSDIGGGGNEILTIYTPGNLPDRWKPGQAKFVRAGSDLVMQLHYTPNGKAAAADRTRVGMVFAKQPPTERVMTLTTSNDRFAIPPGEANYLVEGRPARMPQEATLMSFFPHMHLRGKAFQYRVKMPGKESEILLSVPKYDFNWQLTYRLEQPLVLPTGAQVESSAWFDNSPNNPFNPDPKDTVRFGEQSWEEMMIGFFDISFDAKISRNDFFRRPAPVPAPAASKPATTGAQ